MEIWSVVMGGVIIVLLVAYSLTGGADYGGGVWDLFARGQRSQQQRDLIKRAIGPIWEANHVWLIVMVVVMFAAFPLAFHTLSLALHIPLTLLLFGIVMRGSAFVFRAYDRRALQDRWSLVFSISSTVTPVMLGVCLGALSTGEIRIDAQGKLLSNFTSAWMQPFPWAVGLFTLTLFAFLAAVYLCDFAREPNLKEDFRTRALISGQAVALTAGLCLLTASFNAPGILRGLTGSPWALPLHVAAAICALGTFHCLWKRRYGMARMMAGAQVSLIVLGWAFAQYPFLIRPSITVSHGAAPVHLLKMTFFVLLAGSALLVPSFIYLFRIFSRDES